MTIIWALLALFSGSALFVAEALRRAPEGYQDYKGFHFASPPSTSLDVPSAEDEFIPERSQHVA